MNENQPRNQAINQNIPLQRPSSTQGGRPVMYGHLSVSPQTQQKIRNEVPMSPQMMSTSQKISLIIKTLFTRIVAKFKRGGKEEIIDPTKHILTLKHDTVTGDLTFLDKFFLGKKDMIDFLEQLSTLLSSGIRLVDSLVIMKQQTEKRSMKKLLASVVKKVQGGEMLSEAIEHYPKQFPSKWISLIRAGEKSGELERILLDLSEDETEQQKLVSALKGAMAYPVFVMILSFVLVIYMLLVVVPEISSIYAKMHQKLPAPTLFIIAISEFIKSYILILVGALIVFVMSVKTLSKYIKIVKELLDYIKLHLPVFGDLLRKQNIAIFSGNFALLLRSGVLTVDALKIVKEALPSVLYKKEMERIISGVTTGKRISEEMGLIDLQKELFEKNYYFPINVSQIIRIGEETGNLAKILEKMKNTYSSKVKITIKTLSSLLEPFMIIFVGVMIGGILLAVILPFFSMKV